jgi:hypothetical protein
MQEYPYPILKFFEYEHLPEQLQKPSKIIHQAAIDICHLPVENEELFAGLRKLLEAKDCFVRSVLSK